MDNGIPGTPGRPWGATRLGPYPTTVTVPFTAVGIDPATQLGVFRDSSGRTVKMDEQHTRRGTSSPTSVMTSTYNSTSTSMPDSSDSDSDSDSDSNSDMHSDENRD